MINTKKIAPIIVPLKTRNDLLIMKRNVYKKELPDLYVGSSFFLLYIDLKDFN